MRCAGGQRHPRATPAPSSAGSCTGRSKRIIVPASRPPPRFERRFCLLSPFSFLLSPEASMRTDMTTTTFTIDGYRVTRTLGVVRGITVRSRSLVGNVGAAVQQLFGGNITLLSELCE